LDASPLKGLYEHTNQVCWPVARFLVWLSGILRILDIDGANCSSEPTALPYDIACRDGLLKPHRKNERPGCHLSNLRKTMVLRGKTRHPSGGVETSAFASFVIRARLQKKVLTSNANLILGRLNDLNSRAFS